tara:strand:+ start:14075 stop:14356 length:282 start_codon:yes stop_codon:yes gene_type:complete
MKPLTNHEYLELLLESRGVYVQRKVRDKVQVFQVILSDLKNSKVSDKLEEIVLKHVLDLSKIDLICATDKENSLIKNIAKGLVRTYKLIKTRV